MRTALPSTYSASQNPQSTIPSRDSGLQNDISTIFCAKVSNVPMRYSTLFNARLGVGSIVSAETLGKEVAEIGELIRLHTTRGSFLGAHCVHDFEYPTCMGVEILARD